MNAPRVELGTVVEVVMGQAPPGDACNKEGHGAIFVKAGEFQEHHPVIREWTTKPLRLSKPDDVLVCVVGATAGKVNQSTFDCAIGRSVAAVRANKEKLDSLFLFHFLQTKVIQLRNRSQGAAQGVITREMIQSLPLDLPTLFEQRRIAAILDQADALRTTHREALAQLDSLAQSIFIEMFGDSGLNPNKWPVVGIEEVCELIVDCVNRTASIADEPTPYKMIRTTNVKSGKVNLSDVRFVTEDTFYRWNRRATPRRGDVLLTREAPVGETGILDSDDNVFLGQRLMLYRTNLKVMVPEYLLFSFQSPFLQNQFSKHGSGSTVKHLPLPACRNFQILLPPIKILNEFATRITIIENLKANYLKSLAELDALFASLQHRAFRGEL